MSWWPGGDRHASGGEHLDRIGHTSVQLAFKALDRFPHLVRRHKYIAGGAAISGSLIALASVAVARRMRGGASAEEAVAGVTEDEISGLHLVSDRKAHAEAAADDDAHDAVDPSAVDQPAADPSAAQQPAAEQPAAPDTTPAPELTNGAAVDDAEPAADASHAGPRAEGHD